MTTPRYSNMPLVLVHKAVHGRSPDSKMAMMSKPPPPSRRRTAVQLVKLWLALMLALLLVVTLSILLRFRSSRPSPPPTPIIHVYRPRITGSTFPLHGFVQTAADYADASRMTAFSVCHLHLPMVEAYTWTVTNNVSIVVGEMKTTRCDVRWRAPVEGEYDVTLIVTSETIVTETMTREFSVRDLWIVAMGDSFIAGQGSPDVAIDGGRQAVWQNRACSRSTKSFAHDTYTNLLAAHPSHGILFTNLACSGGTMADILGEHGQLATVRDMQTVGRRINCDGNATDCATPTPDLIMVTVGGNDVQYTQIMMSLAKGDTRSITTELPGDLVKLQSSFDRMATVLSTNMSISPSRLVILPYYDISRDGYGSIEGGCMGFDNQHLALGIRTAFDGVNELIKTQHTRHNWTVANGVTELFSHGGVCSDSRNRLIVTTRESLMSQGNPYGALHPTRRAHRLIGELLWPIVEKVVRKG